MPSSTLQLPVFSLLVFRCKKKFSESTGSLEGLGRFFFFFFFPVFLSLQVLKRLGAGVNGLQELSWLFGGLLWVHF